MKTSLAIAALCGSLTTAMAADLPAQKGAPAAPPPPAFTWTGFYLGAQLGYAFGRNDTTYSVDGGGPVVGGVISDPGGVVGGLHAGYDWEVPVSTPNKFVLGIEGDLEGASYSQSVVAAGPDLLTGATSQTRAEVFGSLRGRLGYAFDHILVYTTGGVAFTSFRNLTATATGVDGDWLDKVGWTVGAGAEYAIDDHWSVRAEYRYDDYGSYSEVLANSTGGVYDARHRETVQRIAAGFSYKFGSATPLSPEATEAPLEAPPLSQH